MALTNQPYIPLYVKDWLTNNKLKMCSTSAHGLLINLMCIMHKEDEYGTILLKQIFKQGQDVCLNFASHLAKLLPFDRAEIYTALKELVEEDVLSIEGDFLICRRMVIDCEKSRNKARGGAEGGKKTQEKYRQFAKANAKAPAKAKSQANAEYENENEIEYETVIENRLLK